MSTIQLWLLKLGIVAALMLAVGVGAWFAADAHYSKKYEDLKSSYQQATKDQAAILTQYAQASMEINDEAKSKLAGAGTVVRDLSVRLDGSHAALQICTSTTGVDEYANRSAAAGSTGPAGTGTQPIGATVSVDPQTYHDELSVAIDAITAELLWRDYARRTGQVK